MMFRPFPRWLLLAVALTPPSFVSSQAQTPVASADYAKAKEAFAAGQYRQAADLFASAAAAETLDSPALHSDALLMEARSLLKLDDLATAESVLRRYVQQDDHSSQALYLLGYVLQRENKPKESLAIFTAAAAIKPPSSNDLRLVALDYVLLDDYTDAVHWLTRSLSAAPANQEAWYDLGRAQMHQGNFVEAERAFHRAIDLNSRDSKALDNLGLTLEAQNRGDEAFAFYVRAIEAQSATARPSEQPLLNYGTLLNARNRSAEAVAPLQRSVALAPGSSRCHEELARAYAATQHDDLARQEMERAVALDPEDAHLHYQLGQLYRRAGLMDRAQQELNRSAELYSTHSNQPK